MGDLSFHLNREQLSGIIEKLHRGKEVLEDQRRAGYLKWRADLFNEYKELVTSAMGSLDAIGGHMRMSYRGESGQVYWKNLAPLTLRKKALARYGTLTKMGALNPYKEYKWDFQIWVDSGSTKEHGVTVSQDFSFVGIGRESKPGLLKRALRTEHGLPSDDGKKVPPRPLFEVANKIFIEAIHKALSNPYSELSKALRQEVIKKLVAVMDWGKVEAYKAPKEDTDQKWFLEQVMEAMQVWDAKQSGEMTPKIQAILDKWKNNKPD